VRGFCGKVPVPPRCAAQRSEQALYRRQKNNLIHINTYCQRLCAYARKKPLFKAWRGAHALCQFYRLSAWLHSGMPTFSISCYLPLSSYASCLLIPIYYGIYTSPASAPPSCLPGSYPASGHHSGCASAYAITAYNVDNHALSMRRGSIQTCCGLKAAARAVRALHCLPHPWRCSVAHPAYFSHLTEKPRASVTWIKAAWQSSMVLYKQPSLLCHSGFPVIRLGSSHWHGMGSCPEHSLILTASSPLSPPALHHCHGLPLCHLPPTTTSLCTVSCPKQLTTYTRGGQDKA